MTLIYRFIVFTFFILISLSACDDTGQRGIDSQEVKNEIRSREIKYISQPQIIDAASKRGQLIADTLQQTLIVQMQKAVAENNLVEAAKYCSLEKLESYEQIQKRHTARIKRLRLQGQKKELQLDEMEKQLLDAYQYNMENKLPLEKNVQKSGNEQILFTAPILLNNTVCLKCHGKVGENLSEQDYQSLQTSTKNFNMDGLVNHSLNQPIAIWSILFERNALVRSIQEE